MRRVRGADTGPERAVRRLLTDLGVRYRLQRRDLPGRPDLAVGRARTAVFVHGCFWHGHDCPRGARTPTTRREYWEAKIRRNVARDQAAQAALAALGWSVAVIWECELKRPEAVASRLAALFGRAKRDGAVPPSAYTPVEPNPPSPREVASKPSASSQTTRETGATTS